MLVISVLLLSLGFGLTQDLDVMNLPQMNAPVVDYTNTLTPAQLDELNILAVGLQSGYQGAQIATVLIPDRQGYELFDIGMKIAQSNKIGQADLDNGLLLVIATDEQKLRIMVGYGLEGVIPDVLARQIIEQDIRPLVNQGRMYEAVQKRYTVMPQYLEVGAHSAELESTGRLNLLGGMSFFLAFGMVMRGGLMGSKLGDYLNGRETSQQLKALKSKSGFISYGWALGFLMFICAAFMGFVAFMIASWIVGFVISGFLSYFRLISPDFWHYVRSQLYRDYTISSGFGGFSRGGSGGFGGGGRSGGGGSFGGGGAGD